MQAPGGFLRALRAVATAALLATPALLLLPAVPAGPGPAAPLPLGTFRLLPEPAPDCPLGAGAACVRFEVACAGLSNVLPGTLAISPALAPPSGILLALSGGNGTKWWIRQGAFGEAIVRDFRVAGLVVAQVRWDEPGWKSHAPEDAPGPAKLACRSATAARWVHDALHPVSVVPREPGQCGFCILGFSNGGSQASYPVTHYGLAPLVDGLFPTGGPVHGDFVAACLHEPGREWLWRAARERQGVDALYGYGFDTPGPCVRQDPSWRPRWFADSVATGGGAYSLPGTRIHFVHGANDNTVGPGEARAFALALAAGGHPDLAWDVVPGTPHSVTETRRGYEALRAAILDG